MSTVVLASCASALAAAAVGVGLIRVLPSLRLQLSALVLLAAALPLAAVLTSGLVMYHMSDDVEILALSIVSAFPAIVCALMLGRWILRPLERVRAASSAIATGRLDARAPTMGPRELIDVGRAFNDMAASIEELFDARKDLVAWASHDLRTPLASLQAMLEALEDGLATPDEYLSLIGEQIQHLGRLVDDLFELAVIDAGALRLELRRVPFKSIVDACVRTIRPTARTRNVQLDVRFSPDVDLVRIAPDKVERVLLNLLTNALRHTPNDGTVAILARPSGSDVIVSVEDTGEGLTETTSRRMFDGFWRGSTPRTRADVGAGLGLAIARGLVEAHGGRIWAENRPTGGARVCFTLPSR
jgi:signal transduction histidine kinase